MIYKVFEKQVAFANWIVNVIFDYITRAMRVPADNKSVEAE